MIEEQTPAGTGTKTAIAALNAKYPAMVQWGMHYAVKIALRKLTVHSREVWDEMLRDKVITGEGRAFWLGAVFRNLKDQNILRKTMHTHKYSDESRGIHERTVYLWELNEKADLTPYRIAPTEAP